MVKTKHKPAATVVSESKDSQNSSHIPPNVAVNFDLPGEDSWVIVKKQKVNILIPRLPSSEQNLDHSQSQLDVDIPTTSNVPSDPPQLSPQKPNEISHAEINDTDITLSPKSVSQPAQKIHTPQDKAVSNPGLRENNFEDQDDALRPLCRIKKSLLKFNEKVHKPTRSFFQKRVDSPGCTTILNKTMRASNIKIKIARAGGLHRWLSSLGLEQFEAIFHGKNITSKFLVANLSMSKLKDMGYHAVGPRRKLIHVIECPC